MRTFFFFVFFAMVSLACATPANLKVFMDTYHIKPDSKLGTAKCFICHTTVPRRNEYGALLAEKQKNSPAITAQMLIDLEAKNGAGETESFGARIKKDELPSGTRGETRPDAPVAVPSAPTPTPPLIPTHTFHPAIVHFPIALGIFGAFFELWGLMKGDNSKREVGRWGLLVGSISLAAAIPTGVIADLRLGYGFFGSSLIHWIAGASAAVLMIVATYWGWKHQPTSMAYKILLLLGVATVGAAGHFGGNLVFG